MNQLTLTRRGLQITVNRQRHAPRSRPVFAGAALALGFPKLENNTLGELEEWLKRNGKAHVVALNALPRNRRTLNALTDLADRYNVALLVRPTKRRAA